MAVEQFIFTHRSAGKGFNPKQGSGFQIAACSGGIDDEARDLLGQIAWHSREAVYDNVHELREREPVSGQDYPPDLLAEFPVVLRYSRVREGLFSLAQTCYLGFTTEELRRPGNYLFHALVLRPEELAPHEFNAVTAARAGAFLRQDPQEIALPTLSQLGQKTTPVDLSVLRTEPLRAQVAAMAAALAAAPASRRPVLLCLSDWRQSAPLVEALLTLLPPTARCRTTFCTCESDRRWAPPRTGAQSGGQAPPHDLVVLCGSTDQGFGIWPDDYRTNYAVFNLVGARFSELGEPGPFAKFAVACVAESRPERLKRLHDLIERLGFGQNVGAWDALVPAATLLDDRTFADTFPQATAALAALAKEPSQLAIAEELILPRVRALAQDTAGAERLSAASPHLAALCDMPRDAAQPSHLLATLSQLAHQALTAGRGRVAEALFRGCGRAREEALLSGVRDLPRGQKAQPASASQTPDRAVVATLLLEGAQIAQKGPQPEPLATHLLAAAFRAARDAGTVPSLWESQGGSMVKSRVGGALSPETEQLLAELAEGMPAEQCPEGSLFVRLKLLESGRRPDTKSIHSALEQAAVASGRCPNPDESAREVLRVARSVCPDRAQQAIAIGRMAGATHGAQSGAVFYTAYRDAVKQLSSGTETVRAELAQAGCGVLLCKELLDEVLPWNSASSPCVFDAWFDGVLKRHPEITGCLAGQVAARLTLGAKENALPLAELILSRGKDGALPGRQLGELYSAVAVALPLRPEAWKPQYASRPDGLAARSESRFRVLELLRRLDDRKDQPGWSIGQFDVGDRAWAEDVAGLEPGERRGVVRQCLATFHRTGITTPEAARALVKLLEAAGIANPEGIAEGAGQLLEGRDPVTCVLVLMAFARCSLEGSNPEPARWGALVRAILERTDKTTRQLFLLHLSRRFAPGGREAEERMRDLCRAAGLEGVSASGFQPPPPAVPAESPPDGQATGVLARGYRYLRRLIGGTGGSESGSDRTER